MKRVYAISIALGVVAGAAWATGSTLRPRLEVAIEAGAARELVAADLAVQWAAVEARARTIAALPRLRAAVATDAETVRDLTADELSFRAAPGEAIELAQLQGGRAVTLLRRPEDAAPVPIARGARGVVIERGALRFWSVAELAPVQGAGTLGGAIGVAIAVAPDEAVRGLAARTPARLVLDGAPVDLAGGLAPDAPSAEVALDGIPGARLYVPARLRRPAAAHALRMIAVAALFAGLALAVVLRTRRGGGGRTDAPFAAVAPAVLAAARGGSPPSVEVAAAMAPAPSVVRPSPPPEVSAAPVAAGPAPPPAPTVFAPGLGHGRFGRYQLLSLLGEGGFEKLVAIKLLRPELAHHERARMMFLDEARVAARVDHPNIVQVYDLGDTDGQYFIAMEYVDGDDLETLLYYLRAEQRTIPPELAVAILQRMCAGLHAAHIAVDRDGRRLQIVHRDVKPGNVLLGRNGSVKVTDFGVAKARQQLHTSLFGETRGTAAFMAPEQRLGQRVDARTDVFGIAAVAYELFSGLAVDLDLARLRELALDRWPHLPPIHDHRPEIPLALEALIFRSLSFAADDRHPSCADLEADLTAVAAAAGWPAIHDRDLGAWLRDELLRRAPPSPPPI